MNLNLYIKKNWGLIILALIIIICIGSLLFIYDCGAVKK